MIPNRKIPASWLRLLLPVLSCALGCGSSPGSSDGGDAGEADAGLDGGPDGGELLAPGVVCLYDAQCASETCGAAGYGNCCSYACDTRDPVCGALNCDPRGACLYPDAGLTCAPDRCESGELATSICDGQGGCVDTLSACPNNLTCDQDAGSCPSKCAADRDCLAGFFCKAGTCLPLQLTGPCASGGACQSGMCLATGTEDGGVESDAGACCATVCNTSDSECGASSCDPTSGECVYAPPDSFCLGTCLNSQLKAGTCAGPNHTCSEVQLRQCPGGTVCKDATSCRTSCDSDRDCDQSLYIEQLPYNQGVIVTPSGNDLVPDPNFCELQTHVCCPAIPTPTENPFPNNGGAYSQLASTVYVDPVQGEDFGCCGQTSAAPCRTIAFARKLYPLQLENVSNIEGPIPAAGTLVGALVIQLQVAGAQGGDWPADSGFPFVVDGTGATMLIQGNGVSINPPPEWDGGPDSAVLQVVSRSSGYNEYLELSGLNVGVDSHRHQHLNVGIALDNGAFPDGGFDAAPDAGALHNFYGNLVLANLTLNATRIGLRLGTGASANLNGVTVGVPAVTSSDGRGDSVTMPDFLADSGTPVGNVGVQCRNATLGGGGLVVNSQGAVDLDALEGCTVNLAGQNLFGWISPKLGIGSCVYGAGKPDAIGIRATGDATVVLNNVFNPPDSDAGCQQYGPYPELNPSSMFRCLSEFGVLEEASDAGAPYVELDNVLVANAGCAGAYVGAGELVVDNGASVCPLFDRGPANGAVFNDNVVGVWLPEGGGKVSMAQGAATLAAFDVNLYGDFTCNNVAEAPSCPAGLFAPPVGVGLLNLSHQTMVVQDGLWNEWDGTEPQFWLCRNATYTSCVCQGPSCPDAGPGPLPATGLNSAGPEAVGLQSNPAGFDFTGGSAFTEPECF